jgi:hypothetical protein
MAVEEPTELEILRSKLGTELEKWNVLGINIDEIIPQGGLMHQAMRMDAIVSLLVEKGVLTRDDMDASYCKHCLELYPKMRKEIEPAVHEARLQAIRNGNLRKQ